MPWLRVDDHLAEAGSRRADTCLRRCTAPSARSTSGPVTVTLGAGRSRFPYRLIAAARVPCLTGSAHPGTKGVGPSSHDCHQGGRCVDQFSRQRADSRREFARRFAIASVAQPGLGTSFAPPSSPFCQTSGPSPHRA